LIPLSLLPASFQLKSKLVARRQGRCAEKASAGKEIHSEPHPCFRRMRQAHRASSHGKRVTPQHQNTPALRERTAWPPGPRNEGRLMVFARNALASGRAMPEIQSTLRLLEKNGGQRCAEPLTFGRKRKKRGCQAFQTALQ
jgi:hypothetical protein